MEVCEETVYFDISVFRDYLLCYGEDFFAEPETDKLFDFRGALSHYFF